MATTGQRLPWEGYSETEEESEYVEVLRNAAATLQRRLNDKGIDSALVGGTALRLADELPRLSQDLDLKVSRATAGADQIVIASIDSTRGWTAHLARLVAEEAGLEGIVVTNETSGT